MPNTGIPEVIHSAAQGLSRGTETKCWLVAWEYNWMKNFWKAWSLPEATPWDILLSPGYIICLVDNSRRLVIRDLAFFAHLHLETCVCFLETSSLINIYTYLFTSVIMVLQ